MSELSDGVCAIVDPGPVTSQLASGDDGPTEERWKVCFANVKLKLK